VVSYTLLRKKHIRETPGFSTTLVVEAVVVGVDTSAAGMVLGGPTGSALLAGAIAVALVAGWGTLRQRRARGAHALSGADEEARGLASVRAVLDASPLGFLGLDSADVIRDANRTAHDLLGRAPDTLLGFRPAEVGLAAPTDRAAAALESDFDHPDGRARRLLLTLERAADGSSTMWVEDVTHRADLARALAEARDQLRHSERLQTLATLAGGLAHDLNNLLAPIIGYADLAREGIEPGSRAIEDIDLVKAAATRAADLVSRLMLLARAERDEVVPVSIQDVVREVLALLAVPRGRQVEIVLRADVSCRPILGTKSQIHRVLYNLCKNAVHAMPDGGTLTVSVESPEVLALWESSPDGATPPFVRVRVEDTGVGMDDRTLERIFEPLFTTREEGEGSGLGLAMVKSIVAQYEGSISVRSRPGQGTTFSLVFAGTR
jgi:signal transduction histidine kinase